MDRVMMILGQANTEAIKEPRGFIKFIQIVIAICAFATAVNNSSYTAFNFVCNETSLVQSRNLPFYYPYNLQASSVFHLPLCPKANESDVVTQGSCYGDFSGRSQLFVFVGVSAFLYSLFMVTFYILADDKYHQIAVIPNIDFIMTVIFTIAWFVFSSAWADGVVKIKHYTDPNSLFLENSFNKENLPECLPENKLVSCQADPDHTGNYKNLNISIVFGFLCFGVWLGNLWFLYKETKWYKDSHGVSQQQQQQQQSPNNMPSSPSSDFQ
ncbi:hypothetical protein HELRODRAFT_190941 [Helobdella robusta]|uniref:MARVEL domain-containing protein n=1 Tax=Helobdella robusta TaxID=6412 RepID=T1FSG0_HELRO|nr:hypothetical protein HELRODRAFT_190941 [Helobdella robusta]ESO08212.1 hypothetical protein HELRODRAFT_190941 [Helobdella robusta]